MKYIWEDLPKPLNCFTVRSASMINLNTKETVRSYAANTKIVVVQKCIAPEATYYRTREAEHHYLNYAFKASAFGLPNEKAPSAPSYKSGSLSTPLKNSSNKEKTPSPYRTQKEPTKSVLPEDGEARHRSWFKRLFGKNK